MYIKTHEKLTYFTSATSDGHFVLFSNIPRFEDFNPDVKIRVFESDTGKECCLVFGTHVFFSSSENLAKSNKKISPFQYYGELISPLGEKSYYDWDFGKLYNETVVYYFDHMSMNEKISHIKFEGTLFVTPYGVAQFDSNELIHISLEMGE
jgi:hypothetical protein